MGHHAPSQEINILINWKGQSITQHRRQADAHACTFGRSRHLDSRDVVETKAPFAAAQGKKIIDTSAEGVEWRRGSTS